MDSHPTWLSTPLQPVLSAQEVHIWRVPLQATADEIAALQVLLAMDEQERATRFFFHADRRRYIVARGALRFVLGRYLGRTAQTLQLQTTDHGKPFLPHNPHQFNVSHAHELALIALVRDRPVGIDIEYHHRRLDDETALVDRFFSPHERAAYHALPPEQHRQAFFNGWTRKEAYIKARGEGLSYPLDSFDVELRPGELTAFYNINQDPVETARWSLHAFTPAPDYTAALATTGHHNQYHYFNFKFSRSEVS